MSSSAAHRMASIVLLSWVSLGIGRRNMRHGLKRKDARLSLFCNSCFCHIPRCEHRHTVPFLPFFLSHPVLCSCPFCVTRMDLDSSGLASTLLSDTRHRTSDMRFTPNASHTQFFNQSTLPMDCTYDTHMTPDSSPMVSALMTVCASKYFFFSEYVVLPFGTSARSCV
jgi:hypothetical protein